jgi:CSLREA domain-containing protein
MRSRAGILGSAAVFALLFLLRAEAASAVGFTVNSVGDEDDDNPGNGVCHTSAGTCTLRAAITELNALGGGATIGFNIPGGGVHTIQPATALPNIFVSLTIDGYSQPGAAANTLAVGDNAMLMIELDGGLLGGIANGLTIFSHHCTVKGLVINRFTNPGISIDETGAPPGIGNNVVQGNFIGTDPTGTTARPNSGYGVFVRSPGCLIGGPNPADRNVIAGNAFAANPSLGANLKFEADFGVSTTGGQVQGNYIGTNAAGTAALAPAAGGGQGIIVQSGIAGGGGVTIGGTLFGARNVISGNVLNGIQVLGNPCSAPTTTTAVIQGNYVGVAATGTAPLGNGLGGVSLECSVTNTVVGGTAAGARNVISGNSNATNSAAGIFVSSTGSGNVIQGNYIGTHPSGAGAMGNFFGVNLEGAVGVTVGGTTAAARNLISGNLNTGVRIDTGSGHTVQGNYIGTDASGSSTLGNGNQGLRIDNSSGNLVGGPAPGAGNVLSANADVGIRISTAGNNTIQKNIIGLNAAGTSTFGNAGGGVHVFGGTGNRITANAIDGNGNLGIDLDVDQKAPPDGPTPNDPCDADSGSNNLQNFPVLTFASSAGGSTTIQGNLNSTASTTFTVEFFSIPVCDPSGYGEGRVYLGSTPVTTDASCHGSFSAVLPVTVSAGNQVTATATDPSGNTSEFSRCYPGVGGKYYTVTPCRVADTRGPAGPYGAPALTAGASRSFVLAGQCGIPATATAVSYNFTITQPTTAGDVRIFPGGASLPLVSALNWSAGQTRANNAVIALGAAGDLTVRVDQASGSVQFIFDVNGYFQ